LGPFVVNTRATDTITDKMLSCLSLLHDTKWKYDTRGIISRLRVAQGLSPYQHDPHPEIERLANRDKWEEVSTTVNTQSSQKLDKATLDVSQTQQPQKSVLETTQQQ